MVTVRELINKATELLNNVSDTPQLDAEVILCNLTKLERIQLLIYPEREISWEICRKFWEAVDKRVSLMPVQYITNHQEFMGFDFYVDERVLIPRGDTEILVEEALEVYKREQHNNKIIILDIGTGSGAIAISLAKLIEASQVYAVDISSGALEVAKGNAKTLGVEARVNLRLGDLFEGIEADSLRSSIDFIISNPPYIPDQVVEGLSPQVKDYEPRGALAGGTDGLDFYKRIVASAKYYLRVGGWIMFEIGFDQGEAVADLLLKEDFRDVRIIKDLAGLDRVVVGKNK